MALPPYSARRFALIALWLGVMIGATGSTVASSLLGSTLFRDVKPGAPYDAAIGEMVELGIMEGVTSAKFKPNAPVKRGELAIILKRFRDSLQGVTPASARAGTSQSTARSSPPPRSSSAASLAYNPAGYIRFTTTTFTVNESQGTAVITIVRTGGNQGTVSVDYSVLPGTATAGTDYIDSNGTLTFANKETSKRIQIQVKDDGQATLERTLTIELKNPQNGVGVGIPSRAVLKILDRFHSGVIADTTTGGAGASSSAASVPVLSFSAQAYGAGEDQGTIAITVVRGGVTATPLSVTYATTNGSATSGDHSPTTGTLNFAAAETSKTFSLVIPDDTSVDGNRTVNLLLSNPTDGGAIGSPGTATLTIYDNESSAFGSGSLKFSKARYEFAESSGKAVLTVLRVGGAKGAATVSYAARGGTASEGTDFVGVAGTLTFAAGEASKSIEVPLMRDSNADTGETISVTLSSPAGAGLGDPSVATITLYD